MKQAQRNAALDQLLELVVLLNEDMTRSLAKDGLTTSRATLLWTLARTGPCPQRVLAEALGVSARTVTGLVDGLAADGFVTREPHPADRRATLVTFTPRAAEWLERQQGEQNGFSRLLFGAMPAERFDGFVAGLTDVLDVLHAQGLRHRPAVTS
ncbi:MAG: MarR family transcriptional regulator [Cryobacterium sp.]